MYSILLSGILFGILLLRWTIQREQAIRAAKDVKKTAGKATTKKAPAAGATKAAEPKAVPKAQKVNMKAAPKVGGKRYKRLSTQSSESIRKMFKKC